MTSPAAPSESSASPEPRCGHCGRPIEQRRMHSSQTMKWAHVGGGTMCVTPATFATNVATPSASPDRTYTDVVRDPVTDPATLTALRALSEAATPGEWRADDTNSDLYVHVRDYHSNWKADQDFIAAACNAVRAALSVPAVPVDGAKA